jgi:hypothetical protein
MRASEKEPDKKPDRSRACVWDVGVQVSSTWRRAKGKASDSYAYGPTFSFDCEKKRRKKRREVGKETVLKRWHAYVSKSNGFEKF